jgi:hypothetical protein
MCVPSSTESGGDGVERTMMSFEAIIYTVAPIGSGSGLRADCFVNAIEGKQVTGVRDRLGSPPCAAALVTA